jgi:hypothetical protein
MVARTERSEIREDIHSTVLGCASLYPGYIFTP